MELIEAGLVGSQADSADLEKDLFLLQKFGIKRTMFPDYFSLKRFNQLIDGVELFSYHFDVLTHPKKESIKMTWDILKSYDSSTIFIRQDRFVKDEEFRDAVYLAKSFTDDVGWAVEAETLLSIPMNGLIQTFKKNFRMTRYLLLDSNGLLLPNELTKLIKSLRLQISEGSMMLFFPSDQNRLGLINALYAMRMGIDGLIGSVLKEKRMSGDMIDLIRLNLLYFHKRESLFSKRSREILDKSFSSFNATGEEEYLFWERADEG